ATPARVIGQHRSQLELLTERGKQILPLLPDMPALVVGDWVLLDTDGLFIRLLERLSLFSRKAAGSKVTTQHIAANVDTVFIVDSLNSNFNLNRIERYLVLAHDAGVEPVVVLTKADTCADPQQYVQQVQALDRMLMVEAVNALDPANVSVLADWCGNGKTVAFLGSSGVGKSTLINTLSGQPEQETGTIREQDAKGRHTTTARSLHFITNGGIEISELAAQCRFSDCQHQNEPGCMIQKAIQAGELDQRRLNNYLKLLREQAFNGASIAEKRAKDKDLGKLYRSVQAESRRLKEGQ
ncbi:unnamed protein product, partial [Cyprideis torosa]